MVPGWVCRCCVDDISSAPLSCCLFLSLSLLGFRVKGLGLRA